MIFVNDIAGRSPARQREPFLGGILNAAAMTGVILIPTTLLGRAGLRLKL